MKNIIIFIRQFFNFFLFLILMGISLSILINYNKTYNAVFSGIGYELTGSVGKKYSDVENYFHLKEENKNLAAQNAELFNKSSKAFVTVDTSSIIKVDSTLKDSTGIHLRRFSFMPAQVVNNSTTEQNNYITIFRGSKQGVHVDMGVIGSSGIAGRIVSVSDNYSLAMSLLNHNSRVSAMLKNGNNTGMIEWDGTNPQYVTLKNIPRSVKIKKGDTVLTSNLATFFPEGIMVGTVSEISNESSSNFYLLKIKTATDFSTLQNVYLVDNLLINEQKQLEEKIPQNQ